MPLTAPTQIRSMDPYSSSRFSSTINRLSRLISGGQDLILFQEDSFLATRQDWRTLRLVPGIAIKDDALIHITANYDLDFSDNSYYVDINGAMESAAWYYVVLDYEYARSLPTPQAYYRIIRDQDLFNNYSSNYIFLWAVNVEWNAGNARYEIGDGEDDIREADPDNSNTIRPATPCIYCLDIDGGILE